MSTEEATDKRPPDIRDEYMNIDRQLDALDKERKEKLQDIKDRQRKLVARKRQLMAEIDSGQEVLPFG